MSKRCENEESLKLDGSGNLAAYWFNEGLESRTIVINDEITSNVVEQVILPLKKFEAEDVDAQVKIYLSTIGGSAWDGMVVANIIDSVKCPVEVVVLGYAMSMGSYILMAGYNNPKVTKKCYPFSFALIHAGSLSLAGDVKKIKQTQHFNDRFDKRVKEFVLTHTKITEEEYEKHEDDEWYIDSDEMLEYGLVDEIIQ